MTLFPFYYSSISPSVVLLQIGKINSPSIQNLFCLVGGYGKVSKYISVLIQQILCHLYIENPETDGPLWDCFHSPKTEEPISAIKILNSHCEHTQPPV